VSTRVRFNHLTNSALIPTTQPTLYIHTGWTISLEAKTQSQPPQQLGAPTDASIYFIAGFSGSNSTGWSCLIPSANNSYRVNWSSMDCSGGVNQSQLFWRLSPSTVENLPVTGTISTRHMQYKPSARFKKSTMKLSLLRSMLTAGSPGAVLSHATTCR